MTGYGILSMAGAGQDEGDLPGFNGRRTAPGNWLFGATSMADPPAEGRTRREGSGNVVDGTSSSRPPVSCQPAHPHFPRATRGALNASLRPAVPRSRCISPFEGPTSSSSRRVVEKAPKGTQHDDDLRGLRSRCEQMAMSGRIALNAPAPLRVLVFAVCVHFACTVAMLCGVAPPLVF